MLVSSTLVFAHLQAFAIRSLALKNPGSGARGSELKVANENESGNYETPADFLTGKKTGGHAGYSIEKRTRKVFDGMWIDVDYLVLKRTGRTVRKFDCNAYSALGNSADFGFFPFLGGKTKQLFVSQDVFRGGCQWVVNLSPKFHVIFDGKEWKVGREAYDLSASDLDKDGNQEIIAPITDFYALQDKMSMADIPLPGIVFTYDPTRTKYVPANPLFKDVLLREFPEVPAVSDPNGLNFKHRSVVLRVLLDYVYAGDEDVGWQFYERVYLLPDKDVMRRRVKKILRGQPVYRFIYSGSKRN